MLKSLSTAATGMQAQQTNLDTIANNIANVSTTGFKRGRAEFEDLMYQTIKEPGTQTGANTISPNGVQVGLGVKTASIQRDHAHGSAKITNNPLDLQIEGAGFFPIMLQDGSIGYTRDGSFKRDANGRIVDKNGNALQPEIVIPAEATAVEISSSGLVSMLAGANALPQQVGQLELVNFVNPAGLRALGKNLFSPTQSSGLPLQGAPGVGGLGHVAQGQLESSNVNIVDEMVNMITSQRAYETNSKVIQAADQMLQYMNSLR